MSAYFGEGPAPGSPEDRLDKLEAEVKRLRNLLLPDIAIARPAMPQPPIQQGCICPIGAEIGCGSTWCPRRSASRMSAG